MTSAFEKLADKEVFKTRYNSDNPFFIAIGDGNHSLAAAKAYWEDLKATLPPGRLEDHPARFAMVEAVNLYDSGISFEPIHRVFFGVEPAELLACLTQEKEVQFTPDRPPRSEEPAASDVGFISSETEGTIHFPADSASETTAACQKLVDSFLSESSCRIDFVHDPDRAIELARKPGNACLLMPKIRKDEFFGFIVKNGSYPRKSFSMGESSEKRYYMEARMIKPEAI
jgi:hypothetical protein